MPAPKKNQFAAKAPGTHKTGVGRIVVDLGALKNRCVKAAQARGLKLTAWVKEKLDEASRGEGF